MNELRFLVTTSADGGREFLPVVDGVPLSDLVATFETAQGWDGAGQYGGRWFDPARPAAVELQPPGRWSLRRRRLVDLLGCECGETACWPLRAQLSVTGAEVRWAGFRQPHRPRRDYGAFGPFVFALADYERALTEAFSPG